MPRHRRARCCRVDLRGGALAVERLMTRARLCEFAPSFGDVATTWTYPARTSHRRVSDGGAGGDGDRPRARPRLGGTRGRERPDGRLSTRRSRDAMRPSAHRGSRPVMLEGAARAARAPVARSRRAAARGRERPARDATASPPCPDDRGEMARLRRRPRSRDQEAGRALPFATVDRRRAGWSARRGSSISSSGPGRRATPTSGARRCPTWSRSAGPGWPPTPSGRRSTPRRSS